MLLFSSSYFVFLIAIFFVYWPVVRFRAASLALLLFANYFFYLKWDIAYLVLIPAASTCDFLIGLGLEQSTRPRVRRVLITLSVLLNVGILAAFKYLAQAMPNWHWTLPLGISFYTFQALSYTLDVYRRDAKATPSLLAYLSAVAFFPTTLAGPITRVSQLLPQLERKDKALTPSQSGKAFFLIGLGLAKKLLIADYLADNLVNRIFDVPKLYSGFEVLTGVYGYALQLYYDFSGYSDIAIGSALLLGFSLPVNFNMPYAAESIADFWRRWHISLSNWLRDYLYFSLPGLRSKYKIFTYGNLVITMLLGGLWHGASWTFVIWGLLHGIGLAVTRAIQVYRGNPTPIASPWARALRILITAQFVCFAWIFFRAPSLEAALVILRQIGSLTFSTANISGPVALVLVLALVLHYVPKGLYQRALQVYVDAPALVQAAAMASLLLGIQHVAGTGSAPFIYTKF
ncbi:MAG TPA: MBOAT family O-acyltransferase [Bryobacteraceae bacterium]|nr:MBOAT family O-acyltransferase [Bryobacteraceae bacterium]